MILTSFDYETEPIANRPDYPPKPVGLAIYVDGQTPYYMAWGHPTGNNCKLDDVRPHIEAYFSNPQYEFIAHNLAFDAAVTEEKLGYNIAWDRAHDTMLLAFLLDPFGELSLKPLAEKYLGEAPVEQDEVRDWLVRHGVVRANDKQWGAHIGKAPGDIVGRYAIGDVRKTLWLYKMFKSKLDLRSDHA